MTNHGQNTPPHLPTYNVRVSPDQIRAIINLVLQDREVTSSTQLQSGESYNNRIYFIETQITPSSNTTIDPDHAHLVLKVSGHYFGARKVQNEIGTLQLLRTYCPSLPIPRPVAWSEDGKLIQTINGRIIDTSDPACGHFHLSHSARATTEQGWILMTRLPGRPLTNEDLNHPSGAQLLKQLASYVHAWRTSIPPTTHIGNIRSHDATIPQDAQVPIFKSSTASTSDTQPPRLDFTIGGLILCYNYDPSALPNPLAYYTYLANDQLSFLRHLPSLTSLLIQIEPIVQSFLANTLPHLSFLRPTTLETHKSTSTLSHETSTTPSYFTHMDLSPRNILVSPVPSTTNTPETLQITGLLDFEFAAFLPPAEEVLNFCVRQASDWSATHRDMLLRELEGLGIRIPRRVGGVGDDGRTGDGERGWDEEFEGLSVLVEVIENIKPWYLQGESHTGEDLEREIERAVRKVRDGIERLGRYVVTE